MTATVGPLYIRWSMDELTWDVGGIDIDRVEPQYLGQNLMTTACAGFVGFYCLSIGCRDFILKWIATALSSTLGVH
jgi:hypothetical protein